MNYEMILDTWTGSYFLINAFFVPTELWTSITQVCTVKIVPHIVVEAPQNGENDTVWREMLRTEIISAYVSFRNHL